MLSVIHVHCGWKITATLLLKTRSTAQTGIDEHNRLRIVVKGSGCLQLVCILLFVGNSATHPWERPFLWNVKWLLSTRVHKCDVFHEDWMWLDADKGANFSCYASVDNKLATHGISSYIWVVGDSSSDKKRETHLTFNQWWVLLKLFLKLKLFFDMHSIDGLDEQRFLKLEVALFCLKLEVSI